MQEEGDANGNYDSIANRVHRITLLPGDVSCFLFYQTVEQATVADPKATANEEEG